MKPTMSMFASKDDYEKAMAEYASMERVPSERADSGWIPWAGGESKLDVWKWVWPRFREGHEAQIGGPAGDYHWNHHGGPSDIVAYRVVREDGERRSQTARELIVDAIDKRRNILAEPTEAHPTPRVDARARYYDFDGCNGPDKAEWVPADLARTLERELAAKRLHLKSQGDAYRELDAQNAALQARLAIAEEELREYKAQNGQFGAGA